MAAFYLTKYQLMDLEVWANNKIYQNMKAVMKNTRSRTFLFSTNIDKICLPVSPQVNTFWLPPVRFHLFPTRKKGGGFSA